MSWLGGVGLVTSTLAAAVLAGCGSSTLGPPGSISVVASTSVYGDIVQQVAGRLAGDKVQITSIINDPSADPHEYEASTRTQLAVHRADLIVENGGGYDDFVDVLRNAAGKDAAVISAVAASGKPVGDSFNEHVWYDFPTVAKVAERITAFLALRDPADADTYRRNARKFLTGLRELEYDAGRLKSVFGGDAVAITEPLPLYLLEACGLVNRTPPEFSSAVADGTDVSPRVLSDTLTLFDEHRVGLLAYNVQTEGQDTDLLLGAAEDNNIPTLGFSETLPAGKTYLAWMRGNLLALVRAEGYSLEALNLK
jgi:zinc/manganese transport system substrate-binding protein